MSGGANNGYPDLNTETCEYIGVETDNSVPPRLFSDELVHEDVINLMSYAFICWDRHFSVGQAIRMHEKVIADVNNIYAPTQNNIASLFEPYKGEYYLAGPALPPGSKPLFQPGFTYHYLECSGYYPAPAPYGELFNFIYSPVVKVVNATTSNYGNIDHINHTAIQILEVDQANGYAQVQKCYNNYNQNPDGGTLIQFNDGVFNTNVTITSQDSTQINNPQMIDNLDPGLYNVIENYNDGSTQETVIIKENN